jgi:hypothetical protein
VASQQAVYIRICTLPRDLPRLDTGRQRWSLERSTLKYQQHYHITRQVQCDAAIAARRCSAILIHIHRGFRGRRGQTSGESAGEIHPRIQYFGVFRGQMDI